MTTKLSTKNAYLGKRYKQISKRRIIDTVGINCALLTDALTGSVPSLTRWKSSSQKVRGVQRTPLPEIKKFSQKNGSEISSLRMPGKISLSRYSRVYNSGDGQLPSGQLIGMPGYIIEPHRARCAPEIGTRNAELTASRNSVTYVHRHSLHSRALPHSRKQQQMVFRRPVTDDLYPNNSFASRYVYAQYEGGVKGRSSSGERGDGVAELRASCDPNDPFTADGECLYESEVFDSESEDTLDFGRSERPLAPDLVIHARRCTPSPVSACHSDHVHVTPRYNPQRHLSLDVTEEDRLHSEQECNRSAKFFNRNKSALDWKKSGPDTYNSGSEWNKSGSEWNCSGGKEWTRAAPEKPVRRHVRTEIRVLSPSTVSPTNSANTITTPTISNGRQLSEYRHQLERDDGRTALTTLSDVSDFSN